MRSSRTCASSATAGRGGRAIRPRLRIRPTVLTLDRPAVFGPSKDRPVLFSALAWADVLLTLDRHDFGGLLGRTFYGLPVATPAMLLTAERDAGRLLAPRL